MLATKSANRGEMGVGISCQRHELDVALAGSQSPARYDPFVVTEHHDLEQDRRIVG
jgi:hypothetical protein